MAKDRDERYKNMEEVMTDLRAIRDGQPPLMARQRFNVEDLEQLEEGMAIETESGGKHHGYSDEQLAKYRMFIILLGALSAVLGLIVLFLLIR